ncbi:MAG: TonB-dependent receptor [Saprospiraceae bacterium]
MRLRQLFPFLFFPLALSAQTDSASLLLAPERLLDTNIQTIKRGLSKRQVSAATRSLEDVDQVPFTVWVVTAQDIQRNGFVTLGDVLRAAPGVRVSQPGNALEGETFLVRGLPGNRYMKVLINDVPIKPTAAPGMPIGYQLPIRQAERIEIVYGPAAAIYGDGACAGVVNIVLKENERPIFTQADLSFGNFGYNSLDLMLGGKLFRDKDIFRFSLYGSSTVRENTDYFYDNNLFKAKNYLPFDLDSSLYTGNPNYRARDLGDSIARTSPIAHESRLLGINLTWRGIHFNYNRLTRFDHSGLGLSPLAISYANPSNRIAEQIETYAFSYQRKRNERTTTNTLSILRYSVQGGSSFTPIFDRLSAALYYAKAPELTTDMERRDLLTDIYRRYSSEERYFAAEGIDVRLESKIDARLSPALTLGAGLQANAGSGVPPMGYYPGPIEVRLNGESDPPNPSPFAPHDEGYLDANAFAQLHWRGKKTTIIGGFAANYAYNNPFEIAPRLAVKYRADSTWAFRFAYTEGFQRPSVYSRVATYRIDTDPVRAEPAFHDLNRTERVRSLELGLRRYSGRFTSDVSFFYQEAHNLARDGYLRQTGNGWRYGFEQAPGLAMALWGIQGTIGDDILDFDLTSQTPGENQIKAHAEFYFQYARGREWFGYGLPATDDVRNYPRWITQLRLSLQAQKWEFMISTSSNNTILGSSVTYRDQYARPIADPRYASYRIWDAMFRLYLSKNFLAYMHVRNIFDRQHAGIDATGTPDDLLYNPQPGRVLRFGVNYDMK